MQNAGIAERFGSRVRDGEELEVISNVLRLTNEQIHRELTDQQKKFVKMRSLWYAAIRHQSQGNNHLREMLQHGAQMLHLEIGMISRTEGDVRAICEVVGAEFAGPGKGNPSETLSTMAHTVGQPATCEDTAKLSNGAQLTCDLTMPVGSFITISFPVLEHTYAITFYSRYPRPVDFDATDREVMGTLADYFTNFLEGQRKMEQMAQLAYNDQLTGLPNRAVFFSRAEEVISMATRYKRECLMLYLDLDGFKLINDTQGHDAGDAALVEVARRLREILRREDFVARIGGDEFALLIPEIQNPGNPYEVIDRIRKIMLEPFVISGNRFFLSTSIGVAMFPRDGTTHTELLAVADKSMYQDKRASPPDRRMTPKRRRTDLSVVI